jgi:hypothetical protein
MEKLNVRWKFIAAGIVVVILALLGWVFFSRSQNGAKPAQNAANSTNTSSTAVATTTPVTNSNGSPAPATGQTAGSGSSSNIPALPGPSITIHLLTPISNNVWTIGQSNPIAWDNAADVTGEIDLVNATTKAFVGVILSETGPKQTSYSWNARSIYLGRYSADEVDVVPGTYSIRIHFDGNGLGDLVSGPITITN